MDPNAGRFVEEAQAESWMQRIEVGEVVKIKGEEFEVLGFEGREIRLRMRSAEDRQGDHLRSFWGDKMIKSPADVLHRPTPRKAKKR